MREKSSREDRAVDLLAKRLLRRGCVGTLFPRGPLIVINPLMLVANIRELGGQPEMVFPFYLDAAIHEWLHFKNMEEFADEFADRWPLMSKEEKARLYDGHDLLEEEKVRAEMKKLSVVKVVRKHLEGFQRLRPMLRSPKGNRDATNKRSGVRAGPFSG